jgi:hypothetical protein
MATRARNLANLLGGGEVTVPASKLSDEISTIEQVSNTDDLTAIGNTIGDQRIVGNSLYIWNGTGWFRIALINETPTWDSGGQPLSSYDLSSDSPQTATIITLAATDPDGLPINYSYITGGSMDSIATISQDSSVFTITPKTAAQAPDGGTGTITFRASDGVNILPQVSSFTLAFPADWSLATQQAKLQGSTVEQYAQFGGDAALSDDGNTAIISAPVEDPLGVNSGAAYIFTRSGTTWTEQAKITASDGGVDQQFGYSVSISDDGNTVIVGTNAAANSNYYNGSAYIFTRSGSTWSQQAKLVAGDPQAGVNFGRAISISGDGNTVLVCAHGDDTGGTNAGSAYVFTRSGSTWSQQAKIQADVIGSNDQFGFSGSLNGDGNTAIIGANLETTTVSNQGAAYIFTRSGSTWSQQAKIVASDPGASDYFGWEVSISEDGNTVVVGAYNNDEVDTNAGAAYIFTRSGTTWSQQAKLTASDGAANDWLGYTVDISNNGNTAVVGSQQEDSVAADSGAVYIYYRSGTTWSQQAKLKASDAQTSDKLTATSVTISGDGKTIIACASLEDTGGISAGSAYVFIGG